MHFAELRDRFLQQMADYEKGVGNRIKQARLQNRPDLTSHEAAAREFGDISSKQWGRWERGESLPRAANWQRLAEVLGVDAAELRGDPPAVAEHDLALQFGRIERKLDALLLAAGMDPAGYNEVAADLPGDVAEVITRGFEDPGTDERLAADEAAGDNGPPSDATPAAPRARAPRKRRSA